ncbi:methyl-accepting chemotaxis protein [Bermanella sp. WJH001]|uniref:methyl-accepting chemotaxis protein n=1 Tax=Bermanella sp. WJH001 TaxID=3048005 RepID=UPI0024BEC32E|nr:methyl-accepting chemotaxis protein [Bermanella sp. WJH001]MDJ1537563.1 methyl-accepting chemotaxis protein [Bermanella sp. WJH001]
MKQWLRALPLKNKLLGAIITAFLVLVVILNTNLSMNLDQMKQELVVQTKTTLEEEVIGRLNSEANQIGHQVSGFINAAYRVPLSVAKTLQLSSEDEANRLTREQVNNLASSTLRAHKDVSSIYAQFEPNGFDARDEEFLGSELIHTVANSGALEIYWIRTPDGNIQQERVENSVDKNNGTVGEFGIRESEWYLCSKDSKKPCAMDPYLYEISEGYSELMTSLVVPVVVNNQFRGVVGTDVNLPIFQKIIEQRAKALYGGKSRITLLSDRGLVAASSQYKDKLTRPLSESRDVFNDELLKLHNKENKTWLHEGTYFVAANIPINASGNVWSILIELPEEVVLANTNQLISTIDSNVLEIISSALIIALVVTLIVITVVVMIINTIVRPIKELDDMIQNLASADGDLTQDIRLKRHAELISLSNGFNKFIVKLREMVQQLKLVGDAAKQTATKGKQINQRSLKATNDQQREIDSVVTATNEMSATASEVSQVAIEVANSAKNARETVLKSQKSLSGSVNTVQELTDDMQQASQSISEVASRTEDINRILDVIRAIAEQTNLLALNAAIEAARAGEQGRGFAVVADEVRSLASKTQTSTEEINQMIQSLQGGVKQAVTVIESGTSKAKGAMEETQVSYDSLASVVGDISTIADHITQVATAAEEQSTVSEEISKNLTIIGDAAQVLASLAGESNQSSTDLEKGMATLDHHLASLKT